MNYLRRGYLKILRQTLLCLCIYFPRQTAARNCGRFDIMRSIAQILPPGISVVVSCILVKFALLIQLVNFYMHRPSSCRSEYFYSPVAAVKIQFETPCRCRRHRNRKNKVTIARVHFMTDACSLFPTKLFLPINIKINKCIYRIVGICQLPLQALWESSFILVYIFYGN